MPWQLPLDWSSHDLRASACIDIQSDSLLQGDSQSDSHTTGGSYSSDYSCSSAHVASDAQSDPSDTPSNAQSHISGSNSSDHSSHPSTWNDAQYTILLKCQSCRVRCSSDHESRSSSYNDAQSALLLKDEGVGQATALNEYGKSIHSKAGTPVVSSPSQSSSANALQMVMYSNSLLQSQRMYWQSNKWRAFWIQKILPQRLCV